jgi:FAD/FMN-containing dehydrogenase
MTCSGDGSTGIRRSFWLFRNWARINSFSVPLQVRPTSPAQIVAAVQEVETSGGIIRALGSGWSYSDVALTSEVTHVIDTSALSNILTGTDTTSPSATLLPFALNTAASARASRLVHVEAGIKIHDLNCRLDALGLAMPTLGGSNGQSLAGVLSTGTHGSDVDVAPITDHVRAIHLIGPGGQEWWIEPADAEMITDPERMALARDAGRLCSDIRIIYDTRLFNAVLVSAGRMGVIYSVVIEAVGAFRLREIRAASTWSAASSMIQTSIIDAGTAYTGPRFLEIVLSPYRNDSGDRNCVVTTRDISTAALSLDGPPQPDVFKMLCNLQPLTPLLQGLAAGIPALIAAAVGIALAAISWMLAIPFVGGLIYAAASGIVITAATAGLVALETALIAALTTPGENIGQKIANICNLASAAGLKQIVPQLINLMVNFIRDPSAGPVVRESFRISTGQSACGVAWEDAPNCMREIDGLEFALDVTPGRTNLFDFMNDIFALTDEFFNANRPAGFGLSLRFTKGTRALIGMQQYARTCSVEFIMLRGFNGHDEFRRRVYTIAMTHAAIPHWGLIHEINGRQVSALYGSNHGDWRIQLQRLITEGGGQTTTFRTSFSLARDLEPLPGCTVPSGLVDLVRRILVALARAAGLRTLTGKAGTKR